MRPRANRHVSLSRREFLRVSGQAELGALALTLGGALPLQAQKFELPKGKVDPSKLPPGVIHLTVKEVTWELAPGKVIQGYAYGDLNRGYIPGPVIRAKEGEMVRILLDNDLLDLATAVHWHGIDEVPTATRAAEAIPDDPVGSGDKYLYEFKATPSGTRWYHPTHLVSTAGDKIGTKQEDLGLAGALIVDPAGPEPFPFDREYILVFDTWTTGTSRPLPQTWDGTAVAGVRGGMAAMMSSMGGISPGMRMMGGSPGTMMGSMVRGRLTPSWDTTSINGKAYPATEPLKVRKGERVRLRFINASNTFTHVIRLAGHPLQVTHTDGNPLLEPVAVDAVPIAVAERYDVLFTADRPGAWFLYCTQPGHAAAGEMALVVYDGYEGAPAAPPVPGTAGLRVWQYALGRGRDIDKLVPPATGQVRDFQLVLTGNPMLSDVWMINGRVEPWTERLDVRKGDLVRVALTNMSPWDHPFHLHGQSYKVVAVNGYRLPIPLVKDTVDVHPHMGTVFLEFTAQFVADWPFHCHIYPHSDGGMFTEVRIRD